MLGHIENNAPRHKLTDPVRMARFLKNIPEYLARDYSSMPLHPTHKSEDERRLARNAKARKARAARKTCA